VLSFILAALTKISQADIFPTGFFGATNAFKLLTQEQISNSTAVVIGCGPVGLCKEDPRENSLIPECFMSNG